jgi:mercuric ion transport protein
MIQVELIYDSDCPAAPQARENLREAMLRAGLEPHWVQWERSSPDTPAQIRAHGSPTILVNGRDVAGDEAAGAASCRIYQPQPGRFAAVPPVELIFTALRKAGKQPDSAQARPSSERPTKAKFALLAIPAAAASMLPALGCPLCWPGYAALLSSLGLGFFASTRYLFPLTIALLALALMGLAIQGRRQGFIPLVFASIASVGIVLGKFVFDLNIATYTGIALLLLASALSMARGREAARACGDCASKPGRESNRCAVARQ